MVCFEAGGGQLRAATGSWVFHEDGDGFDEGGRWRKGYPLRFIVVNLARSRHIRRRRYTQGWTVFDLPSTPDPGQTRAPLRGGLAGLIGGNHGFVASTA